MMNTYQNQSTWPAFAIPFSY